MNELLDKPILEQMYELRKEDFEQYVYENDEEIRNVERTGCQINEEILSLIRNCCKEKETLQLLEEKVQEFSFNLLNQISYWSKTYYLLGANDMFKLKKELTLDNTPVKKERTFLEYSESELKDYIESKMNYNSKSYKKFKATYKEIEKNFPKVFEAFEFDKFEPFSEEEVRKLMEFIKVCYDLQSEKLKISFKAGIEEILNF